MSETNTKQPPNKLKELDHIVKQTFNDNKNEVYSFNSDIEDVLIRLNRKMGEITDVKIMLPIIKSTKKLHDWFETVIDSYNADAKKVMLNFSDRMINNNTIMLERLKYGLAKQEFDGQKLSEKELYNIFDRNSDALEQRIKGEGNAISYKDELFSVHMRSMEKRISKAIGRNRHLKRFWMLLPAGLILAFVIFIMISVFMMGSAAVDAVANNPEIINTATDNLGMVNDFLKETKEFASNFKLTKGLKFSVSGVISTLVFALTYFIYVKIIARVFAKKLNNKLEQVLMNEYNNFKTQQQVLRESFKAKMEQHFVNIEKIYSEFLKEGLRIEQ
ncbi:MAG: hypothetical protein CVU92_01630 [Firmicutes bacterium HGW-Firmicutes-17]|jgi:hypothetical protein|nr:MAG: hypothetical protein CVU92_01630 [Firmicutes bacterium HGW-Firmicutes-17]